MATNKQSTLSTFQETDVSSSLAQATTQFEIRTCTKSFVSYLPDNNDPRHSRVMEVTISPDATLVAAGNLDAIVRIWDVATGALLERLQGHKDGIYSAAFISDGKGLVSGSLDKSVKYWDVSALAAGSAESKLEDATSTDTSSGPSSSSERPAVPCTMDFVGHKVGINDFRNDLMPIIYSTGLCSVRLYDI